MSVMSLSAVLRPRFFDHSSGAPLNGGKLNSYQAGTTTPQNTYTDQGGLTPNTNPVILDANGECNLWLDPTLSYKFVLTDSAGNLQWTVDNVVGILTVNAVNTAALQDGSVTTPKHADNSVTSAKLSSDASVDGNRAVGTNHVQNQAITSAKIANGGVARINISTPAFIAPTAQKFLSGSGTYNLNYAFVVSAANATVGATYTHNAITYTVYATVVSANLIYLSGSAAPLSSGTLTKSGGTGDSTIAFTTFAAPVYIRVRMVGGGGGGGTWVNGGSSLGGGAGAYIDALISSPSASYSYAVGAGGAATSDGGDTTFGTNTAGKGLGSGSATNSGGAATLALGVGIAMQGNGGGAGSNLGGGSAPGAPGGSGGIGPFGGTGRLTPGSNATGIAAAANSGSGGGGGSSNTGTGGAGGSGIIIIDEHYQ